MDINDPRVIAASKVYHTRTRSDFDWDNEQYGIFRYNRQYDMRMALEAAYSAEVFNNINAPKETLAEAIQAFQDIEWSIDSIEPPTPRSNRMAEFILDYLKEN